MYLMVAKLLEEINQANREQLQAEQALTAGADATGADTAGVQAQGQPQSDTGAPAQAPGKAAGV